VPDAQALHWPTGPLGGRHSGAEGTASQDARATVVLSLMLVAMRELSFPGFSFVFMIFFVLQRVSLYARVRVKITVFGLCLGAGQTECRWAARCWNDGAVCIGTMGCARGLVSFEGTAEEVGRDDRGLWRWVLLDCACGVALQPLSVIKPCLPSAVSLDVGPSLVLFRSTPVTGPNPAHMLDGVACHSVAASGVAGRKKARVPGG